MNLLLLLPGLFLLVAAPAFGQLCGAHPHPEMEVVTSLSTTIPDYPSQTMLRDMERTIRNQFYGDQDGGGVDTACWYEPVFPTSVPAISLPPDCSIITSANVLSCFQALGASKVAIVEEIRWCGIVVSTEACAFRNLNSSFIARTSPRGDPNDPALWDEIYLRSHLITQLGWDVIVRGNGNLFNFDETWDGRLAQNECVTMLDLALVRQLGEKSYCHNETLTSNASVLPNGNGCRPDGILPPDLSCENGLCTGPPVTSCNFKGCDSDGDGICSNGSGGVLGDDLCTGGDVLQCDDNCGAFGTDQEEFNPDQADFDGDRVGDECDNCDAEPNFLQSDSEVPQGDGVGDACDNCPEHQNPGQENFDFSDGGDACDVDDDNDGLFDLVETGSGIFVDPNNTGTNPLNPDTDGDGFRDGLEVQAGSNPNNGGSTPSDTDVDGKVDVQDNCTLVANPSQLDVNSEGFGNICDPDVTDDGIVGALDVVVFQAGCFGMMVGPGACSGAGGSCVHDPTCAESDFTGDGVVGAGDLSIFGMSWAHPPGPSGLSCAGTTPCP